MPQIIDETCQTVKPSNSCIFDNSGNAVYDVKPLRKVQSHHHQEMRFMTGRLKEKDEENETESDWKFAAMVIDRCQIDSI